MALLTDALSSVAIRQEGEGAIRKRAMKNSRGLDEGDEGVVVSGLSEEQARLVHQRLHGPLDALVYFVLWKERTDSFSLSIAVIMALATQVTALRGMCRIGSKVLYSAMTPSGRECAMIARSRRHY